MGRRARQQPLGEVHRLDRVRRVAVGADLLRELRADRRAADDHLAAVTELAFLERR